MSFLVKAFFKSEFWLFFFFFFFIVKKVFKKVLFKFFTKYVSFLDINNTF
jgi:hypothetical protein